MLGQWSSQHPDVVTVGTPVTPMLTQRTSLIAELETVKLELEVVEILPEDW